MNLSDVSARTGNATFRAERLRRADGPTSPPTAYDSTLQLKADTVLWRQHLPRRAPSPPQGEPPSAHRLLAKDVRTLEKSSPPCGSLQTFLPSRVFKQPAGDMMHDVILFSAVLPASLRSVSGTLVYFAVFYSSAWRWRLKCC